jgi:hypothetical protein
MMIAVAFTALVVSGCALVATLRAMRSVSVHVTDAADSMDRLTELLER